MGTGRKTRLTGFLVASACLALALAVTVGGLRPASADQARPATGAPEVTVADGVPIPPSVRPVVVVSGSDYDIGYQYFQQLAQIFGPKVLQTMQNPAGFSDEQLTALKAYQWYIKEYMPELIEEFKGMAAGATDAGVPLSYTEVLASNIASTEAFPGTEPPGSQGDTLPPDSGCSGFAAWGSTTKDGKLICAGSQDDEHAFGHLLIVFPETGNDYIVNVSPRWAGDPAHDVSHPGMNNKGLCYVHHGAGVRGNEEQGYASVGAVLCSTHTLRFADTAAQALEMQLGYPPGMGWSQRGLYADTGGDAFDIECRDPQTIRRAGDNGEKDFLYATNNVLAAGLKPTQHIWLVEEFGWDLTFVPHGGWTGMDEDAVRRNLLIWNMLHNYHGKVDLAFVKMMWRFPGRLPDYPSLEAADEGMYANQSAGWDSKICALANSSIGICQPDNGEQGLYFACNGSASRQANAQCPGYYFWTPAATHTFYQVQLAADPEALVSAAKDRAMLDMAYANIELRKLTYADVAFAPLSKIFDQAVTEWYRAGHYQNLAGQTAGNESALNYGKALRGFTRCQAYANQVYESLVPPPDTPSDLGLKKYWGGWGEWTSWLGSR